MLRFLTRIISLVLIPTLMGGPVAAIATHTFPNVRHVSPTFFTQQALAPLGDCEPRFGDKTNLANLHVIHAATPLLISARYWWGELYEAALKGADAVDEWMDDSRNVSAKAILFEDHHRAWALAHNGQSESLLHELEVFAAPHRESLEFISPLKSVFKIVAKDLPRTQTLTAEIVDQIINSTFEFLKQVHTPDFFIKGEKEKVSIQTHPEAHSRLMQKIDTLRERTRQRFIGAPHPNSREFDAYFNRAMQEFTMDHSDYHRHAKPGDPLMVVPGIPLKTALVVDDEAYDAEQTRIYLERLGYWVIVARSFKEARSTIQWASQEGPDFSLVMTDRDFSHIPSRFKLLHDMDGLGLALWVRWRHPEIKNITLHSTLFNGWRGKIIRWLGFAWFARRVLGIQVQGKDVTFQKRTVPFRLPQRLIATVMGARSA